ncbi:hypothetical protein ACH5RR_025488 [Cinchona calisaya]|uniref:DUF4283 domain-containing protein n=1 Tax=Cinchona calisaya TaxID=153742 RepID=A0ABD2Z1Q3_9GENT
MAEELAKNFEKFELSKKEQVVVKLCKEDVEYNAVKYDKCLIEKIIGERVMNFVGVKIFTSQMWGYPKKLEVIELGVNTFQFFFDNMMDLDKVLKRKPWVIDNQLLEYAYPLDYKRDWHKDWGCDTEVIVPNTRGKKGKHVKVLAEIDLNQPLLRRTMLNFNNMTRWVEFTYEKCPDFCYKCGIIGYNERSSVREKDRMGRGAGKAKSI